MKVNVWYYRCFKGGLTIYGTNVLNLGCVAPTESSTTCLTGLYLIIICQTPPAFLGSAQHQLFCETLVIINEDHLYNWGEVYFFVF